LDSMRKAVRSFWSRWISDVGNLNPSPYLRDQSGYGVGETANSRKSKQIVGLNDVGPTGIAIGPIWSFGSREYGLGVTRHRHILRQKSWASPLHIHNYCLGNEAPIF